jgi:hypothetical protein
VPGRDVLESRESGAPRSGCRDAVREPRRRVRKMGRRLPHSRRAGLGGAAGLACTMRAGRGSFGKEVRGRVSENAANDAADGPPNSHGGLVDESGIHATTVRVRSPTDRRPNRVRRRDAIDSRRLPARDRPMQAYPDGRARCRRSPARPRRRAELACPTAARSANCHACSTVGAVARMSRSARDSSTVNPRVEPYSPADHPSR